MKILLNILTHGDEAIGIRVAQEIEQLGISGESLVVQRANQRAYEAGQRYIDQDLNRSFPGKEDGNHEQRLAHQLLPEIRAADIVIDIHSTKSDLEDTLIVDKLDDPTVEVIDIIQPKYVLIMKATKGNALISHARIGIAFEYGKDDSARALFSIVRDIKKVLRHYGLIEGELVRAENETTYFEVAVEVSKPEGYRLLEHIKNYVFVPKGAVIARKGNQELTAQEDFYPVLFGQDNYPHIFGFMAQKIG